MSSSNKSKQRIKQRKLLPGEIPTASSVETLGNLLSTILVNNNLSYIIYIY